MNAAVARFYWSQIPDAKSVLDLGCASGDFGRFKPANVQIHGLDINAHLLDQARVDYESATVWDLDQPEPLPFSDNVFDAVVAKDILEHLQKPWQTMREVRRVLRPGGYVLASVISHRGRRTWSDYTHVRGFTMRSVRQMFTDVGFEVLGVWRMGGVPLSSRLNSIGVVPHLLRFPLCDWIWTSSYELIARNNS